nr:hypothetical protein [Candidatus Sigynarchaeota archaeon]
MESAKCGWNVVITPKPKWQAVWRRCCLVTAESSYERPGKSASLKTSMNVDGRELGKPVASRISEGGIRTVRDGEGAAGMGIWKKRMPWCNVADRTAKQFVAESSAPKGGRLPEGLVGRKSQEQPEREVTLDDGATR